MAKHEDTTDPKQQTAAVAFEERLRQAYYGGWNNLLVELDDEDDDSPLIHRLQTIDAHTEGEPLRIIFGGYPTTTKKGSVLDRRRHAEEGAFGYLRQVLMWEPRGHADMYGCVIVPPNNKEQEDNNNDDNAVVMAADFGVLFLHNEGYSSMCGHGIIAVTKVAIETGLVVVKPSGTTQQDVMTVQIDAPAGRIVAYARLKNNNRVVSRVAFDNVPSYVVALDQMIRVAGIAQPVEYDLAFGGAYYAYVDASQFANEQLTTLEPKNVQQLIDLGMRIKRAIMETVTIQHPKHDDLAFLYGTIFVGPALVFGNHSRNVCIFADGQVDRSPTGTGVSGRAAIHYARGELALHKEIVIESILGTTFTVEATKEVAIGDLTTGIVPRVSGQAFVTGKHEFVVDPDDPLKHGFLFR
jgi:trans-L-3-hydroxyproline dehydratase